MNHIVGGISDETDVVDTEDIYFSNNIGEQVEKLQGSADLDLIDSDHFVAHEEVFFSELRNLKLADQSFNLGL